MILLWLLMYLAPIFVIVAIWTKLIQKTWVKIVVTFISAFALLVTLALWTTHNELEECEDVKSEIVDVMYDYSDCVDYSVDRNDYEWFVDCWFDLYDIINE